VASGTAVILGSGTATESRCWGSLAQRPFLRTPKPPYTSFVLADEQTGNLQIDCAPEIRLQLTREEIYDLEAVLITIHTPTM